MHRVLVIVPVPLEEELLVKRREQLAWCRIGPDVTFEFRPVKAGPDAFISDHDFLLADVAVFEAGMRAQDEGYSAVCMDTVTDSGMNALRSVLDIPVVGPGKASYLMALLLGKRFSVLTMWDEYRAIYEMTLQEYGFADRCVSVRSVSVEPDLENLLAGQEDTLFPRLAEAGRQCLDDGADVICLGSTVMHHAGGFLAASLPVPVINPGPLSYKLIEAVLGLGLTHSRRAYPRPHRTRDESFELMLDAAAARRHAAASGDHGH
jgi:allantoin racemase